jgi:hypothetical protein
MMLVYFVMMFESLARVDGWRLVMYWSVRARRKELFVMLELFAAVGKREPVSHQRLGVGHPESVVFQLGMPVAKEAPPVVREPVRVMAGR